MKAGMAISKAAPSTMGTLMATGFLRGGKAVSGSTEIGSPEFSAFLDAFCQGMAERGKAKLGEKTVIDVAGPTAKAVSENKDKNLDILLTIAEKAAAVFREKTIGLQDPGGTAYYLLIQGFAKAIK